MGATRPGLLAQRSERVERDQLGVDDAVAKERERLERLLDLISVTVEDEDRPRPVRRVRLDLTEARGGPAPIRPG
jgi:hypothetical protein